MMRTHSYVLGDSHGNFKALKEVLSVSHFDYDKDRLIILGDIVDGHKQTYECVEELLKIKNRIFVLGNHDDFFISFIKTGATPWVWTQQGGEATLKSYAQHGGIPKSHKDFFLKEPVPYYSKSNRLFIHGGLGSSDSPLFCDVETLTWDRSMIMRAKKQMIGNWSDIFVGHTTTKSRDIGGEARPYHFNNVWCVDCGAGWGGKLCLMDIDTKKYWLSERSKPPQSAFG